MTLFAYNAAASTNAHIGEDAGILSGEPVLRQIQGALRQLTGYAGTGEIGSLAALGISLDKTGTMTFDSTKFYTLSTGAFESALDLMGSTQTGFGALAKRLDEISNPITGFIKTQQDAFEAATPASTSRSAIVQRIGHAKLTGACPASRRSSASSPANKANWKRS
jgi:hypothetical protein